MAKVTSKYQVTLPKAIANQYRIRPGDHIDWVAAGEVIRVRPPATRNAPESLESRLRIFDDATERQRGRGLKSKSRVVRQRGWKREDLYSRGRSR